MQTAAIVDVDGTLVDSNYQHTLAWARALAEHGCTPPLYRIHRSIGMGGDKLVEALGGQDFERRAGDAVRDAESRHYGELIGEVRAIAGARELLLELRERGHRVVLASSAPADEVEHYLNLLEARELTDAWTSADDVEKTKPDPDLVGTAMRKAEALSAVMIGDTVWDVASAARAEVKTIGLLTGGFAEAELIEAGAVAVFESAEALREGLGTTPLS